MENLSLIILLFLSCYEFHLCIKSIKLAKDLNVKFTLEIILMVLISGLIAATLITIITYNTNYLRIAI